MQQPGTRTDYGQLAQGREQVFLNMYANRLYNQAANSNSLTYDGANVNYMGNYNSFPTHDEAWNDYSAEARNRGITPNPAAFEQVYRSAFEKHGAKMNSDLDTLVLQGVPERKVQEAAANNPDLQKHLIRLGASNPEWGPKIQQFLRPKTLSENIEANPNKYRAIGTGAALLGAGVAHTLASPAMTEADRLSTFKDYRDSVRSKAKDSGLREARRQLKTAKTLGDQKAGWQLLNAARDKYKADLKSSRALTSKALGETKFDKYLGPESKFGRAGSFGKASAYSVAPWLVGMGAELGTGDKRVGEYASRGTGAAIAAASTQSFLAPIQEYIKRKGGSSFMKMIMNRGGRRMALSLAAKGAFSGTGVGALVSGGLLANDLMQIAQWAKEDLGYAEGSKQF